MEMLCGPDGEIPDKLKNIEPRLIEHISNEIMEKDPNVRWSDIGTSANSNVPDRQSILVFFFISIWSHSSIFLGISQCLPRG
jgi:hypothetical protein